MVVEYLELVDPPASQTAADRYGCFLAASEEEYSKACLEDARLDARGAARRVDATRDGCERVLAELQACLLYTSPSPRDKRQSRMPSSA